AATRPCVQQGIQKGSAILEAAIETALRHPKALGEDLNADAVNTALCNFCQTCPYPRIRSDGGDHASLLEPQETPSQSQPVLHLMGVCFKGMCRGGCNAISRRVAHLGRGFL